MNHYTHKRIPDAKFESGSSSSFGDMTSQGFPLKKGTNHKFGYLSLENGFNKKNDFLFQNRSSRPKVGPLCQFQQFPSSENLFHFQNFCDFSMRKNQQQIFLKFGQNMS